MAETSLMSNQDWLKRLGGKTSGNALGQAFMKMDDAAELNEIQNYLLRQLFRGRRNASSELICREIEDLKNRVFIPIDTSISYDVFCELEGLTIMDLLEVEKHLCKHLLEQYILYGASGEKLTHDLIVDTLRLERANRTRIMLPLSFFISFKTTDSGKPVREVDSQ